MNLKPLVCLVACLFSFPLLSQDVPVPLWPNGAPGFESRRNEAEIAKDWYVKNIHNPSITVFLPPKEKANGAAILICPGGGFKALVFNSEGKDPAIFLNSLGVAVFVLKYRLFREENSPYTYDKETREDAARAMRLVRSRAKEWGVDPNRLGIMGFSAGGEVVAKVAYEPGDGDPKAVDPVDRLSARPNFQILIYPGPLGVPDKVTSHAPPAFLLASNFDDCCSSPVVKILNAYREVNIPIEVHIYDKGAHGFNMGYRSTLKSIRNWPGRLSDWLEDNYFFDPSKAEAAKKEK